MQDKLNKESVKEPLELISSKLVGWYETILLNLPNLILGLVIFIITFWLSRMLKRFINNKLTHRIEKDSLRSLIANVASFVIIILGIVLALSTMNLDTALKSILAGAGVAGLATGLALQGVLSNMFSGVVLSIKDIINVGDWVETNRYAGVVDNITLRNTFIRQKDNNMVVIPNSMVLNNPFMNVGLTPGNKIIVNSGVHYDSDLREVKKVLLKILDDHFPAPAEDKQPQIFFTTFNDSSIDFEMRFWFDINDRASRLEAKSEAIILT